MTSLRPLKTSMVRELFVHTADENYMTARWCAVNGLHTDFFWLAVHALEKYMKAALLVNGSSAKPYAHDITKLYPEVKKLAGNLLSPQLTKPASLDMYYWFDMTAEKYLSHLYQNGKAENRYMIFGYSVYGHDLYMLDQMIFAIRRLIVPLDEPIARPRRPSPQPVPTYREILLRSPSYRPPTSGPLDKIIKAKEPSAVRFSTLNLNLAFAPAGFRHRPNVDSISSQSAVIARRILMPLQSSEPAPVLQALELAAWLFENVQFNKNTRKAIEKEMAAARARHNLP